MIGAGRYTPMPLTFPSGEKWVMCAAARTAVHLLCCCVYCVIDIVFHQPSSMLQDQDAALAYTEFHGFVRVKSVTV